MANAYIVIMLATSVALSSAAGAKGSTAADLVLRDGRIITMNAADDVVEAIAMRDGRIIQVGSNSAIQRLVGPSTRIIELRGRRSHRA